MDERQRDYLAAEAKRAFWAWAEHELKKAVKEGDRERQREVVARVARYGWDDGRADPRDPVTKEQARAFVRRVTTEAKAPKGRFVDLDRQVSNAYRGRFPMGRRRPKVVGPLAPEERR